MWKEAYWDCAAELSEGLRTGNMSNPTFESSEFCTGCKANVGYDDEAVGVVE